MLALTLIPAATLASTPKPEAKKAETHRVERTPARHVASTSHTATRHVEARHEPARHVATRHEPEQRTLRRTVAYHPKFEHSQLKASKAVYYAPRAYSHWESCVPFARATSGIMLKGNAANWWDAAAGVYARGHRPEPGSVLNFRSTGRMRLGHVSVVTQVVNGREVMVDHANWWGPGANKNGIARNVPVIDVSPANDWTEVRVGLGAPGEFGSVYPTYGFIYDRPDNGVVLANAHAPATAAHPALEVAEAPDAAPIATQPIHHSLLDFTTGG